MQKILLRGAERKHRHLKRSSAMYLYLVISLELVTVVYPPSLFRVSYMRTFAYISAIFILVFCSYVNSSEL